jgi:serine/threonine protein kinase
MLHSSANFSCPIPTLRWQSLWTKWWVTSFAFGRPVQLQSSTLICPSLLGTRLGPYEILSAVGAGGMGEVYRARDMRLDRIVAIKFLLPRFADLPEFLQRFEREAHIISSSTIPTFCALYDVRHTDGQSYLIMEYLEGETLAHRMLKSRLEMDEVKTYAIQIASALRDAHARGIIHRDLKPANVMITRWGVKLMDFGLAKIQEDQNAESGRFERPMSKHAAAPPSLKHRLRRILGNRVGPRTTGATRSMTGNVLVGTLPYMAPEQLLRKNTDWRTDTFAFWCPPV